jgi:hypothetical protein
MSVVRHGEAGHSTAQHGETQRDPAEISRSERVQNAIDDELESDKHEGAALKRRERQFLDAGRQNDMSDHRAEEVH